MTESAFPDLTILILGFCAGFACAIWFAVAIEHGAHKIAEQMEEQAREDNLPLGG